MLPTEKGSDPIFMMNLERHLDARLRAVVPDGSDVCVGLSGGLDSIVLLDLLARIGPTRGHRVSAVHVHHGLSPNADAWALSCAAACEARGVALALERVQVDLHAPAGLEAAARAARYAAYGTRPEPIVALAHHLDDQAETLLLQLLRGTGLKGVAAMPELRALPGSSVQLFRPLLGIARAALREYALARHLAWVEDESNASLAMDRNYLRHEIAPRLDARFAGWREAAARFARHAAGAEDLLAHLARADGVAGIAGEGLRLDATLSASRRANALRAFLAAEGLPMPGAARLAEMARQLYEARPDARVRIEHAGATLVRRRAAVHVAASLRACAIERTEEWRVAWHGEPHLDLGPGRGQVRFETATGAGLAYDEERAGEWHFAARRGGERLRLAAGCHSRTLKNLLQEASVPEWLRGRLPLLYRGERLAWVPGIGIAAELACAPGRPGLVPSWRPEPESASGVASGGTAVLE
jgi:tRNA(Ile)-lysidine synthase